MQYLVGREAGAVAVGVGEAGPRQERELDQVDQVRRYVDTVTYVAGLGVTPQVQDGLVVGDGGRLIEGGPGRRSPCHRSDSLICASVRRMRRSWMGKVL